MYLYVFPFLYILGHSLRLFKHKLLNAKLCGSMWSNLHWVLLRTLLQVNKLPVVDT